MRSSLKILAVSSALWLAVALISFGQSLWAGFTDVRMAAQLSALDWGPWLVLTPLIVHLAFALPITSRSWKWVVPVHFVASFATALLVNWMTLRASRLISPPPFDQMVVANGRIEGRAGPGPGPVLAIAPSAGKMVFRATTPPPGGIGMVGVPPPPPPDFEAGILHTTEFLEPPPLSAVLFMSTRLTLPIYWLIVVATLALRHHRLALEREGRALRAERELVQARLAALQTQLQPHFLFNSLNAISAFIAHRPAAADNMVCALSDLLRAVLNVSDRTEIPLHEELDFSRRYLAVHRIRFEDALRVEWTIAREAEAALVPTLVLQPILENALEHGLGGSGGELAISATVRDECLLLAVTNHSDYALEAGGAATVCSGTRTGLRNTRARLAALFGPAYRLELIDLPGGARAEIELPLRRAPA